MTLPSLDSSSVPAGFWPADPLKAALEPGSAERVAFAAGARARLDGATLAAGDPPVPLALGTRSALTVEPPSS